MNSIQYHNGSTVLFTNMSNGDISIRPEPNETMNLVSDPIEIKGSLKKQGRVYGYIEGSGSTTNGADAIINTYWQTGTQVLENGITYASGIFTLPKVGRYLVSANLVYSAQNGTGHRAMYLSKAGGAAGRFGFFQTTAILDTEISLTISAVIEVASLTGTNNKIAVYARQTSGIGPYPLSTSLNGSFQVIELL